MLFFPFSYSSDIEYSQVVLFGAKSVLREREKKGEKHWTQKKQKPKHLLYKYFISVNSQIGV